MVSNQNKHTGLSIIDKREKIPDLLINSSIHYLFFFPEEFHRNGNKHREEIQNGKCLHFLHSEEFGTHRTILKLFLNFQVFCSAKSPLEFYFFGGVLKSWWTYDNLLTVTHQSKYHVIWISILYAARLWWLWLPIPRFWTFR